MSINTSCESCIFAHPVSDKNQCDCGIIEAITYNKEISEKNGYNYIDNYMCRMAFSKETYEANQERLSLEQIKHTLKNKCSIKYYLIIDVTSQQIDHLISLCQTINGLTIQPRVVSFMFSKTEDIIPLVETIRDHINTNIQ